MNSMQKRQKIRRTMGVNCISDILMIVCLIANHLANDLTSNNTASLHWNVAIWDDVTMEELEKIKGNDSIENVLLNMLAYLFEFVYDLCIGSDGVSESTGFEQIAHTYQVDDD